MRKLVAISFLFIASPAFAQEAPAPAPPPPPAPPAPVEAAPPPAPPPVVEAPPIETTPPADNDAEGAPGEDHDDDQPKQGVTYEPRRGVTIRSGKTRLRFFLGTEVVMQEGHCVGDACETADALSIHVRRARFSMEAKLKHHLYIDFGIQVKNEIIVLKNANFAWKRHGLTLKAGFLKPPGGIERDASTWVKPFPERSVVANFKQDRIIGFMASKWLADKTVRIQGAAGHPPSGNFDAFEPEDVVAPPPGIEPEDLTTDPGNWDLFATGAYAPSDNFEIAVNATAHIAPDAGQGPNFSEPYETKIVQTRFFKGAFLGGGADTVWHSEHVRASAELTLFDVGDTIPHTDPVTGAALEPTDGSRGEAGYVVLGFSPHGHYGKAIDNAPLLESWQVIARGEFLRVTPGSDGGTGMFGSVTGGLQWQAEKQLRLQIDCAVQKYNEHAIPANANVWRIYSEIWGQVLI
jgi:hypothetical protein